MELPLHADGRSKLSDDEVKGFHALPETAFAGASMSKRDLLNGLRSLVVGVFGFNSRLLRLAVKLFPDMSVNFVNHDIEWDKVVKSDATPPDKYISPQVLFES